MPVSSGSGSPNNRVGGGKRLTSEVRQHGIPLPDRVLGHVDDRHVRRAVEEKSFPVRANVCAYLVHGVVVVGKVRHHAATRLDLVDEIASSIGHRMVNIHGVIEEELRQPVLQLVDARQIRLGLRDKDIDACGILGRQIRRAVRRRSTQTTARSSPAGRPKRHPSRASAASAGS